MVVKDAEKSSDPWHEDNVADTLENRIDRNRKVRETLWRHSAYIITQLKDALPMDEEENILADTLTIGHENFKQETYNDLRTKIDELFDPGSEHYGSFMKEIKDLDPEEKELIAQNYLPHVNEVKKMLGRKDFINYMDAVFKEKINHVGHVLASRYGADIKNAGQEDVVLDYLMDKIGVDRSAVNYELMKLEIPEILSMAHHESFGKDMIMGKYAIAQN